MARNKGNNVRGKNSIIVSKKKESKNIIAEAVLSIEGPQP